MNKGRISRIGFRIAAPAAVAAVALVVVLFYMQRRQAREGAQAYDGYADLLGRLIVNDLRDGMLSEDRPRIQRELTRLADMAPIRSARVVDKQGKVVFASDAAVLGTVMSRTEPSCVACHQRGVPAERRGHILRFEANGRRVHRVVQPITLDHACLTCHEEKEGAVVGVLITDLDDDLLTGGVRADSTRSAWAITVLLALLVAAGAVFVWRHVVTRIRNLRHLLDLLRSGARASVLSVSSADEIDEVTRAVQALALDLDGRVGLERASRRLAPVLEREAGAVLLVDADGWIFAANRAAVQRMDVAGEGLIGRDRSHFEGPGEGLSDQAHDLGWALPAEGQDGPAVVALADAAGKVIACLELWAVQPGEHAADGVAEASLAATTIPENPEWLLYGAVLAESIRPSRQGGPTVMRFDPRLARARRLAGDLVALGSEAATEREQVDLKSLGIIMLWDLERDMPLQKWYFLYDSGQRVTGARYQLRALLERLARAAGRQAGPGGQVVLFTQARPGHDAVFVAAWASRAGGSVLLDPPDGPALASAIASGHGGGVEVDPAFDMQAIPGFMNMRLPCGTVGTLFVAELAVSGTVPKPHSRHLA